MLLCGRLAPAMDSAAGAIVALALAAGAYAFATEAQALPSGEARVAPFVDPVAWWVCIGI